MRLTTLLGVSAFIGFAVAQRRWLPILSCLAWFAGFETLFELARIAIGNGDVLGPIHIAWELLIGPVFVTIAWRAGARPSWPILSAALVVFGLWVVTGFHVNEHTTVGIDPWAEVCNELSKTLWAVAYLVPLRREGRYGWSHPHLRDHRRVPHLAAAQKSRPAAP